VRVGDFGKSLSQLHAKVATIDHRTVFIGSLNFDARSSRSNTEIGLPITRMKAGAHRSLRPRKEAIGVGSGSQVRPNARSAAIVETWKSCGGAASTFRLRGR
jgi:putative cardiolipin synthase